jgi:hypothetical protein
VSERSRGKGVLRAQEQRTILDCSAFALMEARARPSREIPSAEGRWLARGWPVTMTEARARRWNHLSDVVRRQLVRVHHDEKTKMEQAARATNARARAVRLAGAEREGDVDGTGPARPARRGETLEPRRTKR